MVRHRRQSVDERTFRELAKTLSLTLFLYSFGYGAITSFSAMYADAIGVHPKSIYLTMLAIVILLTRPLSGTLADRIGYRRVFLPCLVLIAFGLTLLAGPASALAARTRLGATPPLKGKGFSMTELVAQAKKEGHLNTIALPLTLIISM